MKTTDVTVYRSAAVKLEKRRTDNWSATDGNSRSCSPERLPEIYSATIAVRERIR